MQVISSNAEASVGKVVLVFSYGYALRIPGLIFAKTSKGELLYRPRCTYHVPGSSFLYWSGGIRTSGKSGPLALTSPKHDLTGLRIPLSKRAGGHRAEKYRAHYGRSPWNSTYSLI